MTESTKIIKVGSGKTLSESDFFNPNLVICFGAEVEYVIHRYTCDIVWFDSFLNLAGIEFAKDKQRVEFLLGRFELVELKNKFWGLYYEDLEDQLKSNALREYGSHAYLAKPQGASSKLLLMLWNLKNKGGPYNQE
jgi:hypothetical protein